MLVKVPQITRILSNRSVAGLRAQMFRSEVLSGTVAVAYLSQQRLALAAYAELFFLLAQNLIILFLIAYYAERPEGVTAWRGVAANVPAIVAYAVVAGSLASGVVSGSHLEAAYNCTTAVLIAGRAPQILANHRARSTGELSFATQALMSAGSAARIFTTAQEGGSASTVGAYLASAAMNWIILAQMVAYKGAAGEKKTRKKKTQ